MVVTEKTETGAISKKAIICVEKEDPGEKWELLSCIGTFLYLGCLLILHY